MACCASWGAAPEDGAAPTLPEVTPKLLPLTGPCALPEAEISGAAWYGDHLILLPQYPERFLSAEAPQGVLCAIPRAALEAAVAADAPAPLQPRLVPLRAGDLTERVEGYQGFEAIAFDGDEVYVTVEAEPGDHMEGFLVRGRIKPDLSALELDARPRPLLEAQAPLGNMAYEAILVTPDEVLTFYEANGARVNTLPRAMRFGRQLAVLDPLPLPALECRLTDVTAPDAQGRFWAMNYCWEGNTDILPDRDPLVTRHGEGASHKQQVTVERLVELSYQNGQLALTDRAPIYLQLLPGEKGRNWEGIVYFGEGFLIITDKHQETTLAWVAPPPASPPPSPR
jgi:hypothetical protein